MNAYVARKFKQSLIDAAGGVRFQARDALRSVAVGVIEEAREKIGVLKIEH